MRWFLNLFRKRSLDIPKGIQQDRLSMLLMAYRDITITKDSVLALPAKTLTLYLDNIVDTSRLLHSANHIIRKDGYFEDMFLSRFTVAKPVSFRDYMVDENGYWYVPSTVVKELLEKLTTLHDLFEEVSEDKRVYYLRQVEPLLDDLAELYTVFA